jgi:thiol-disulfide isomerase/thioredoxin
MYDQVYEAMVCSDVAIKLDDAVWLNKENHIVQSK